MRRSNAPSQAFKRPNYFTSSSLCVSHILEDKNDSNIIHPSGPPKLARFETPYKEGSNIEAPSRNLKESPSQNERYFSVVWCKKSNKKHKKWEGDAIIVIRNRTVVIKDMEGKEIGSASGYKLSDIADLEDGALLTVGGKEVEIQSVISQENYLNGRCFQSESLSLPPPPPSLSKFKPFRSPLDKKATCDKSKVCKPLFDPALAGSLVMPRPPFSHQWHNNSSGEPVVDVVVDPRLSGIMRNHQSSGIIFIYECVLGFRQPNHYGAILADEMGLGKTLQCITLIWTLLKQGPYGGQPLVNKVLIVTPSSLTVNWQKEFVKWLGKEKIHTYVADQSNRPEGFLKQHLSPVLIISYELLARNLEPVKLCKFDLLLCDEGHRLKNSNIQIATCLNELNIKRRVLLTGTPVQNNLKELYSLVDFVNPGVLGTPASFRKLYEEPIVNSKESSASEEIRELGEQRAAELKRITSNFILRRTQSIIDKYLPPKVEFVVFCKPAPTQAELYRNFLQIKTVQRWMLSGESEDHLAVILFLRKLCNHPLLLWNKSDEEAKTQSVLMQEVAELASLSPFSSSGFLEEDSGKLATLSCMLWSLQGGGERVVLVSNFTSTLDILASLCDKYDYKYLRLDGSTPTTKRQSLVDRFNSSSCTAGVFLLSAKAGGLGLNLIGASRIILYDIDWNPATDLQAMARVWRDGQKKHVHIYRFILAGSIEEKMYQRQISKQNLGGSVVDNRGSGQLLFSLEELKDLLSFSYDADCQTHEFLHCSCDLMGGVSPVRSTGNEGRNRACQLRTSDDLFFGHRMSTHTSRDAALDQLLNWQHFAAPFPPDKIRDDHLLAAADFLSFLFKKEVTDIDDSS